MKTGLLLIDIQNDYFQNGRMPLVGADKASRNAGAILNKFRKDGWLVTHIQHIATRPGATFFLPTTDGIDIHPDVYPKENEKVIVKHYPNSFRETGLLEHLKTENITDLVICGMMTQHCVDSTTRAAKDLGFNCTVIGDACATKDLEMSGQTINAEEVQRVFLAALNFFFSTVKTTEEFLGKK